MVWEIAASGAATKRATQPLGDKLDYDGRATAAAHGVVALALHGRNGQAGPVFVASPGAATMVDAEALQLGSVDGAGRVWYQRQDGLVARELSGRSALYPTASMELIAMAWHRLRCYPVGAGFPTLPAPGAALTEQLTLELASKGGDPLAEIVVCDALRSLSPHEVTPCANDPARITGKLDDKIRWKARMPIGIYSYAVKLGEGWFVSPGERCELRVGKPCTLGARGR